MGCLSVYVGKATAATRVVLPSQSRTQGYLFTNDIEMCTGICLGDIPVIKKKKTTKKTNKQKNEQYTTATSVIEDNY